MFEPGTMLFIDRIESPQAIILRAKAGTRFPMTYQNAIGLIAAAFTPASTPSTVPDSTLRRVRKHRFAHAVQNQGEAFRAASPIFDRDICIGCVAVAAPAFRVTPKRVSQYEQTLVRQAGRISDALNRHRQDPSAPELETANRHDHHNRRK